MIDRVKMIASGIERSKSTNDACPALLRTVEPDEKITIPAA